MPVHSVPLKRKYNKYWTVWANVRMARCYVPCVDYLTRTPPMLQKGFVVRVDMPKLMSREWTVI